MPEHVRNALIDCKRKSKACPASDRAVKPVSIRRPSVHVLPVLAEKNELDSLAVLPRLDLDCQRARSSGGSDDGTPLGREKCVLGGAEGDEAEPPAGIRDGRGHGMSRLRRAMTEMPATGTPAGSTRPSIVAGDSS
jgi:hypothetical protein